MARHADFSDTTLSRFLGADFIKRVNPTDPEAAPLRIGADVWTAHQLAKDLGVVHVAAARILSRAAADMQPPAKHTADFFERSNTYNLAGVEGLGLTTLYVAWRLFESKGLNPNDWYHRGLVEAQTSFVKFKKREQDANRRTKAGASRRSTGNAAPVPVSASSIKKYVTRNEEAEREAKREAAGLKKTSLKKSNGSSS